MNTLIEGSEAAEAVLDRGEWRVLSRMVADCVLLTLIRLLCHLTSLFGLLPWDVKHKCNGDFVQTSDGVGWGDSKGTQIDLSEQQ